MKLSQIKEMLEKASRVDIPLEALEKYIRDKCHEVYIGVQSDFVLLNQFERGALVKEALKEVERIEDEKI